MIKEKVKTSLGKYCQISFTLKSNKHKTVNYFELYGYVTEVEDKNMEFKDNYNHVFIVPLNRVNSITLAGERRKAEEYSTLKKEAEKAINKLATTRIKPTEE